MRLFRTMREEADGLPSVGPGARLLGIRPGDAPDPDVLAVDPTDSTGPTEGGLSMAPDDPLYLPRQRRPASLGGLGRDPVWYIEKNDLGPDLQFRQDKPTHGLIEPRRSMTLQEFQNALAQT